MTDYIDLNFTADPEELRQDGRDWIEAQAPAGYAIDPLVDWMLAAVARMAVEVAVLAGQVPRTIFQIFGEDVLGVAVLQPIAATATATFTLTDTAGHTIEEGAELDVDGVGFVTTTDLVIAPGSNTGNVPVVAIEPGSAGSGLGDSVELISPSYIWVDTVTLTGPTAGGRDAESGDEYVDRLADELPALSIKAITASDFERLARADPDVFRALVLDNYDPGPPIVTSSPGSVTLVLQDDAGDPVSGTVKTRVEDALEADRVLALSVHIIDATYSTVKVSFTALCYPDADPATVETQAEQAISDFLSPAAWGRPVNGDLRDWINEPQVRRNDLIGVLYGVPGVRHVEALTLALGAGALATTDVTLPGPAGLPEPGAITGTVTR